MKLFPRNYSGQVRLNLIDSDIKDTMGRWCTTFIRAWLTRVSLAELQQILCTTEQICEVN